MLTPVWKGISRQNDTILPTFSETKLQGSSVLLTPEASTPKIGTRFSIILYYKNYIWG